MYRDHWSQQISFWQLLKLQGKMLLSSKLDDSSIDSNDTADLDDNDAGELPSQRKKVNQKVKESREEPAKK